MILNDIFNKNNDKIIEICIAIIKFNKRQMKSPPKASSKQSWKEVIHISHLCASAILLKRS